MTSQERHLVSWSKKSRGSSVIESVQLRVGQAKTLRREIQSKGNERTEEEMQGRCQALRAAKSLL